MRPPVVCCICRGADVYDRLTPQGRKPKMWTLVITQVQLRFQIGCGSPAGAWEAVAPKRRVMGDPVENRGQKRYHHGERRAALAKTQAVSGLWHGVFPGYALFFLSSAFFMEASKVIYRYERNWSERAQRNPLWTFAKYLYTQSTLQYLGSAFVVRYKKHQKNTKERFGRARCSTWPPLFVVCLAVLGLRAEGLTTCSLTEAGHALHEMGFWLQRSWLNYTEVQRIPVLVLLGAAVCGGYVSAWRSTVQVLTLVESLEVWRSVHFFGHFAIISILSVGYVFPPKTQKSRVTSAGDLAHAMRSGLSASIKTTLSDADLINASKQGAENINGEAEPRKQQ
jgi:hypothetical protein